MSSDNANVARVAFDTWNRGDMDAYADLLDDEVIVRPQPNWPEPGPFVGKDAVMRQFSQLRATFDSDTLEPISDFVTAADRVAVRMIWRTVGGRGPDANMEMTVVYTVRRGRLIELEFFWDHADVIEWLGLAG